MLRSIHVHTHIVVHDSECTHTHTLTHSHRRFAIRRVSRIRAVSVKRLHVARRRGVAASKARSLIIVTAKLPCQPLADEFAVSQAGRGDDQDDSGACGSGLTAAFDLAALRVLVTVANCRTERTNEDRGADCLRESGQTRVTS
jgi:hypothetical protein